MAAARPDVLFVAVPAPKREHFLGRHEDSLSVPFVMGVGESFDVVAGKVSRAPHWMQASGLERLCCLLQEPRRMAKRCLVGNSRFIMLALRHWTASRSRIGHQEKGIPPCS
jgi:N-acetylglucosaminyldiphosphoundecaprenol N-acetyl-beta-D-mannosaminyltransferase